VIEGDLQIVVEAPALLARHEDQGEEATRAPAAAPAPAPRPATALVSTRRWVLAPAVPDAEWQPLDTDEAPPSHVEPRSVEVMPVSARRSHRPFREHDDSPTRIQPVDELLDDVPRLTREPPPAAPASGATLPPSRLRIRRSVRRVALFALLASAFMLWLHATRAHRAQVARAHAAHVRARATASGEAHPAAPPAPAPAPVPAAAASSVPSRVAAVSSVALPAPQPPSPLPQPSSRAAAPAAAPDPWLQPTSRKAGVTKARAAADALANGALGEALTLYQELAASAPGDAAYAEVVRSLKARGHSGTP